MDALTTKALVPVFTDTADRTRELMNVVTEQLALDSKTGAVTLRDADGLIEAYAKFAGDDGKEIGGEVVDILRDGYLQFGAVEGEARFGVPWRALGRSDVLSMLGSSQWRELGFRPLATVDSVRKGLASGRFGEPPQDLLDDEILNNLAEWAANRRALDLLDPRALPKNTAPEVGGDVPPRRGGLGGGGGGGGSQGGQPPVPDDVAKDILDLVRATGECLLHAKWSFEGVIGVRVCFDKECADKLETALLGSSSAKAGQILQYFLANFKFTAAAFKGALSTAGGWVGLALLHFSLYWGILIAQNKTDRGVCLIHVWPWISGATGGIFHGWAEGRRG